MRLQRTMMCGEWFVKTRGGPKLHVFSRVFPVKRGLDGCDWPESLPHMKQMRGGSLRLEVLLSLPGVTSARVRLGIRLLSLVVKV
uniref:Uncharacterized protein n=1 Tax=Brassica campestris TaxID=3711 RepID=A0A3P6AZX4_BRACM|nr:unnamed protein product [Brassica rapa]